MSAAEVAGPLVGVGTVVAGTLGPTGFAALTWGAIGLVLVVFAFIVWALLADR